MSSATLSLSVVLPLANDPQTVRRVCDALAASTLPRGRWELIIVATQQPESAIDVAAEFADVIVRLNGNWSEGDAYLYNRGAEIAHAPVIAFFGAEVCVRPETLEAIDRAFTDESLAGLVGTLDAPPPLATLLARTATVTEQWVQSHCLGESEYFGVQAAAIRTRVFFAAGELDEWQPMRGEAAAMELGLRLAALGFRVELRDDVRVMSVRRTSWRGAIRVSALRRSPPPWMPTPVPRSAATRTTRFRRREGYFAILLWSSVIVAVYGMSARSPILAIAGAVGAVAATFDLGLVARAMQAGGLATALGVTLSRGISLGVLGVRQVAYHLRYHIAGEPLPDPGLEALSEVGVHVWPPSPSRAQVELTDPAEIVSEPTGVA